MRRVRPDPSARRAAFRARAAGLRAMQEQHRSRLRERRRARKKGEDRRWRWLGLLLLLLLLAILCCGGWRCDEPVVEPVVEAPVEGGPGEVEPAEPDEPDGRIDRQERPGFKAPPAPPPSWIDAFRMQVAARSPRLAECFEGSDRPGTLKWTTTVEPTTGLVSEQELEPMLMSAELTSRERACVLGVLEDPPYKLDPGEERTTPSRVGIVIEF